MVQHISEKMKSQEAARNVAHETILEVETGPCSFCGQPGLVRVFPRELRLWESGLKVQDAFVGMSADEREMLISGTHPKCWEAAFGEEE
jgi:hypothetical protein